jgi:hypothetical protein
MAFRRTEPKGFTEDLALLLRLEAEKAKLQEDIDEVFLRLTADNLSPTQTIAEALRVTGPAVSSRRRAALKRRDQVEERKAA